MYSSKAIANFFLDKAKNAGEPLTQMKLHKLIYYAHGWFLGLTNEPLIDEELEAWQYGPFVPSLRGEFRDSGANPITRPAVDFDLFTEDIIVPTVKPDDSKSISILDQVWKVYGGMTAAKLSSMTHEQGSPWSQVWKDGYRGIGIPNSMILNYFKHKATLNAGKF